MILSLFWVSFPPNFPNSSFCTPLSFKFCNLSSLYKINYFRIKSHFYLLGWIVVLVVGGLKCLAVLSVHYGVSVLANIWTAIITSVRRVLILLVSKVAKIVSNNWFSLFFLVVAVWIYSIWAWKETLLCRVLFDVFPTGITPSARN